MKSTCGENPIGGRHWLQVRYLAPDLERKLQVVRREGAAPENGGYASQPGKERAARITTNLGRYSVRFRTEGTGQDGRYGSPDFEQQVRLARTLEWTERVIGLEGRILCLNSIIGSHDRPK